jgi:helicase
VKLRGIGRVRARRLFNNGISSPEAVRAAGIETVTRIIGRGIAEQIFDQLDNKKRSLPVTPREVQKNKTGGADEKNSAGQSTLSCFR